MASSITAIQGPVAVRSCNSAFTGRSGARSLMQARKAAPARNMAVRVAAEAVDKKMFYPGAVSPGYLDGSLAGDYGFDPLGFGADPVALQWYRQAELVHGRWAMLGTAGIIVQEYLKPDIFWYEAGLPENLPEQFQNGDSNLAALFAWEFVLMHFVEVARWLDYKNFGSVNYIADGMPSPLKLSNKEMGYPGGVFDPFGFAEGNLKNLQTKEIKNGRLAMVAFVGFTIQAQALGEGPIECWREHISDPWHTTIFDGLGKCVLPDSVVAAGVTIPTPCLWP